ncbi:MAG: hypothetical protein JXR76_15510 [Deltaproteobacteria bacterium]|nr:hypothetical protein [Deltaproteobacteria bacterium]
MSNDFGRGKTVPLRPSLITSTDKLRTETDLARRKVAFWGGVVAAPIFLFFSVFNSLDGRTLQGILDLSCVGMSLCVLWLVKSSPRYIWGFRLAVFIIVYTSIFTMLLPNGSVHALLLSIYGVPVLVFYLLGLREGLVWSAFSFGFVCAFLLAPNWFPDWAATASVHWDELGDILVSFVALSGFSAFAEWFRRKTFADYLLSNDALNKALSRQTTLQGLVPICSSCKKIRGDNGYWIHLENFLSENTLAHISTGICDKCAAQDKNLRETDQFTVPDEVANLSAWKHSEENKRRHYFKYFALLAFPGLVGYAVRDWILGHFWRPLAQVSFGVIVLVVALNLKGIRRVIELYHGFLALLFVFLVVPFYLPTARATDHLWLYLFPLFASFAVGFRAGLIWICAMLLFVGVKMLAPSLIKLDPVPIYSAVFFVSIYLLVGYFSSIMAWMTEKYLQRVRRQMNRLEQVYDGIQTLKGLVPVCSVCKSIRNDDGYWTRVDFHLYEHTEMLPNDAICPDCLKENMPEIYEEMKKNGEI